MDNDKQIKNHINLFLKDDFLENLNQKPDLYNLEEEFSKTKRNKNVKLWKITGISLGAILLFVIISSFVVQIQKNNIKIDINDFEDTNLMDMLSNNSQSQKEYDDIKMQINDLESEFKIKIKESKDKTEKDIDIINAKRITDDIKKAQINNANKNLKKQLYRITLKYNKIITLKKNELKKMERSFGVVDKNKLEEARKKANSINNQNILTNIEIDKIKNNYELKIQDLIKRYDADIKSSNNYSKNMIDTINQNHKEDLSDLVLKYNPKFSDQSILDILNTEDVSSDINIDNIGNDDIKKLIEKRNILIEKLYNIDYTNSIPRTLKTIDFLDKKIIEKLGSEKK